MYGLNPQAPQPVIDKSKGCGWGRGGANSRVLGCTLGDMACTQASDTAKSPTFQGLEGALLFLIHGVTGSPSWKDLKGHVMLEHLL